MRKYSFASTLFVVGVFGLIYVACMLFGAWGAEPLPDADPNWYTAKQTGLSLDQYIEAIGDKPENVYEP